MASAPLLGGAAGASAELPDEIFAAGFHRTLVHECVRAERAARRRGTAATRTRGKVSGGGVKPWRQKGTGRARAGSIRSPIWRGGGTVFGPQPRSYAFKVNRKERRAALRSALSLHAGRSTLALLHKDALTSASTAAGRALLAQFDGPRPLLAVVDPEERALALSLRNLAAVRVIEHADVGVTEIVGAASLLLSERALEALCRRAEPPRRPARAAAPAGGAQSEKEQS
ncbi:MAG TPA: 50S ribosomal protein L4 [Solirubrobacteraceae bacterium]|nr:50S ribosomal protein L4 [Solirubrobacteraceae bacterium]